jgi:hypothetical protein
MIYSMKMVGVLIIDNEGKYNSSMITVKTMIKKCMETQGICHVRPLKKSISDGLL